MLPLFSDESRDGRPPAVKLLCAYGASISLAFVVVLAVAISPIAAAAVGLLAFGLLFVAAREARKPKAEPQVQRSLESHVAEANKPSRRPAMHDTVSGLYSRWYLELRISEEADRCNRYGLSMAVAVIRLAGFGLEAISTDSWNQVAAEMAKVTTNTVRTVDLLAALGPMEFAVCLVHCDQAGATSVARRLAHNIGADKALIGVAVYPHDNLEASGLVELARRRVQPPSQDLVAA